MIQTRPFEFMVRYTPQREWIQGKGILLWLAFFFIELGAGMFVIASILPYLVPEEPMVKTGSLIGMVIGWLICGLLGGGTHLAYLGKPINFYRAFLRPNTSWISRGMAFVMGFLGLGFIYMILTYLLPQNILVLMIVVDLLAFLTVVYGGFAMNFVNGIPLWNTALLPILYIAAGFWGGAEMATGIVATMGIEPGAAHLIAYILLFAIVIIIPAYLISVRYGSPAGEISAREILTGKRWPLFWLLVVFVGILIPVIVALLTIFGGIRLDISILWIAILCGLVGDLTMRYLLLKNGYYAPLTPISDIPTNAI